MADSFSVTLVSNQNEDVFVHNTSSSFSNVLPRTTDLSNYEVAVESVYLTDHHPKQVALTTPAEPKMFFNLENKENEVTVIQFKTAELKIYKQSDDFVQFLDGINNNTAFVNMPVTLTKTVEGSEVTQITLTYNPKPGYDLYVSDSLKRIFGFTNNSFAAGTYLNDAKIDSEFFKTLANGSIGELTELNEETSQVEVRQVPEKPDLHTLLGLVQAALSAQRTDVRFEVDVKNSVVSYNVKNVTKRVMLSKFINVYLGREPYFALIDKGSFKVPRNILYPSKIKPPPRTCSKILVLCDLIQPQVYAGKEMPLLAVIDRKYTESETEIAWEPRSLLYKAIQVGKVNQIKITLQSDNNDLIKSQNNPTVVNLHFRKNMRDIQCDEKGSCKLVNMDISLESDSPTDLILMDRSPSRSPSPVRYVIKRKQIKAAPGGKAVSKKRKAVETRRPKQVSKVPKKQVKRGRPPKATKVPVKPRGRPPTKAIKPKTKKNAKH